MQLTNIARDVGEDGRAGRLYLPTQWLEEAEIDPDRWLAHPEFSPALGQVISRVLDEADELYSRADLGITMLPWDCRPAIRAARLIYADIGRAIRRQNMDSVSQRAYTTGWRKLRLLLQAIFRVPTRSALESDTTSPLTATAFLLQETR
jgi:phytoene synthase